MKVNQILENLQSIISKSTDEDFIEDFKIVTFNPVSIDEVNAIEEKLEIKLPLSYIAHITKHGIFHIGSLELWPIGHLSTGLKELGSEVGVKLSELGIEKTCEKISKILTIPEENIRSLNEFICFATYYGEDHYAFDLRTKNSKTTESECKMIHFDDVDAIAKETFSICQTRSFDYFIFNYIKKALEKKYNCFDENFKAEAFLDN